MVIIILIIIITIIIIIFLNFNNNFIYKPLYNVKMNKLHKSNQY